MTPDYLLSMDLFIAGQKVLSGTFLSTVYTNRKRRGGGRDEDDRSFRLLAAVGPKIIFCTRDERFSILQKNSYRILEEKPHLVLSLHKMRYEQAPPGTLLGKLTV